MTTEAVKSVAITALDTAPVAMQNAGRGVPGVLRYVDGSAAVTSGVTATSTYQLCRIPTNACVKSVKAWLDAGGTTITGDLGLYYSTGYEDGTKSTLAGTALSAALFGSAVALAAIVEPTEFSGESGTYVGAKRIQPLWQAAGLSSDPGGYFDLVFGTTATTGSAAVVNAAVEYVL